jgi:hypothetical protein
MASNAAQGKYKITTQAAEYEMKQYLLTLDGKYNFTVSEPRPDTIRVV